MKVIILIAITMVLISCNPTYKDFQENDTDIIQEIEKTPEELEQEKYPGIMTYEECLLFEIDNIHMCVFECTRTQGCYCKDQCADLYCSYEERIVKWQKGRFGNERAF